MQQDKKKTNKISYSSIFFPIWRCPVLLFLSQISQQNVEIANLQESLDANNTQKLQISPTYKKSLPHVSEKHASMQQEVDPLNNQLNNLLRENKQAERLLQEVSLVHLKFSSKSFMLM